MADVLNDPSQQRVVIRELTPHYLLPDDVAKDSTEIFVAGIRHERPRICHHADKPREQTGVRESFQLGRDPFLLIEEPPGAAVLQLARSLSILEAPDERCQLKCVPRVHVVDDHLRQSVFLREQVEVGREMLALRKVANGVITGICSKRAPGHGVHVALRAKMQLLGPSFFGVEATKKKHHEGSKLDSLLSSDGLAFARS